MLYAILLGLLSLSFVCSTWIQNPSFENEAHWQQYERTSTWTISRETDAIMYTSETARNGARSLIFKGNRDRSIQASYINQHVTGLPSNASSFTFLYWVKGSEAKKLKVKLYVAYQSNRLFTPTFASYASDHSFKRICYSLPNYGTVRSIMIFFAMEERNEKDVFLDDVELKPGQLCPNYVASAPRFRPVFYDALVAALPQNNKSITIATQLTIDRMKFLADNAERWRGPISAAILVYADNEENDLRKITEMHTGNQWLNQYVTIHFVFEDRYNRNDGKFYPVNFLRNVALKGAKTSFVLLVDVDMITNDEEQNVRRIINNQPKTDNVAFILPLFNQNRKAKLVIPRTKEDLLNELSQNSPNLSPFSGVSHAVVKYKKWYSSSVPYAVKYEADMEPYFVIKKDSPLTYEMFEGYGRDKCSYSRNVHEAGFEFTVLSNSFLINREETENQLTIIERSGGLHLETFFSIDFHHMELMLQRPMKTFPKRTDLDFCSLREKATLPETIREQFRAFNRLDNTLETLVKEFSTSVYVELPSKLIHNSLRIMLPYMQLDAAIAANPRDDTEKNPTIHYDGGVFWRYSNASLSQILKSVKATHKHTGMAVYVANSDKSAKRYLLSLFELLGYRDVIIIHKNLLQKHEVLQLQCEVQTTWSTFEAADFAIYFKRLNPKTQLLLTLPTITKYAPICIRKYKTSLVLMTKNRPLQTMAFLESAVKYLTHLYSIIVIAYMDNAEIEEAYRLVINCFKKQINILLMQQQNSHFGTELYSSLLRLESDHVIVAVDEIIWLRPVDLDLLGCLLSESRDVSSVQLRLGKNVLPHVWKEHQEKFQRIEYTKDLYVYYPLRLPYDYSYVIHVDGLMMRRYELLQSLEKLKEEMAHPADLENRWFRQSIHGRARQWQVTYDSSRMVNNALKDGRVIGASDVTATGYSMLRTLSKKRKVIDIDKFKDENINHESTHIFRDVAFKDLVCR